MVTVQTRSVVDIDTSGLHSVKPTQCSRLYLTPDFACLACLHSLFHQTSVLSRTVTTLFQQTAISRMPEYVGFLERWVWQR